jgi:hypothetical protein
MLTEKDILQTLDNTKSLYYDNFVSLGHPYSFLIDVRLNVFRSLSEQWAIIVERLGYNPRHGFINLELYHYGNCLIHLDSYVGQLVNCYEISPIDEEQFWETVDSEVLKPTANEWIIRGNKIPLSHLKEEYVAAGIELKEYTPNEIRIEDVGRLLVTQHRELFRATDEELYARIPKDLRKILILDEWFHKDFDFDPSPTMSDEKIKEVYDFNKDLTGLGGMNLKDFTESVKVSEQ